MKVNRCCIALLSIVTILLAGCSSAPTERPDIVGPSIGSWALYSTHGGVQLNVTVVGETVVRDAWGEIHPAMELRYHFQPPVDPQYGINVTEYISVSSGLHIRHETDCHSAGYYPGRPCDPDLSEVVFVAHGLPGALGMGPQWAGKDLPGDRVPIAPVGFQRGEPPMREWTPMGDGDCWMRQPEENVVWSTFSAWLPITAISTPLVQCTGLPFPTEFIADMGFLDAFAPGEVPHFTLVAWAAGSGQDWPDRQEDEWHPMPPPEPGTPDPLGLLGDEGDIVVFSSREAHELLMDEDETYNRWMTDGASVTKISHDRRKSTMFFPGMTLYDVHQWRITVRASDSALAVFTVHKKIEYDPLGGELKTSHEFPPREDEVRGPFPDGPLPVPVVSLQTLHAKAVGFYGCNDPTSLMYDPRFDVGVRDHMWYSTSDERAITRIARHPDPPNDWIVIPWKIDVDGLTGGVTELVVPGRYIDKYDAQGLVEEGVCPPPDRPAGPDPRDLHLSPDSPLLGPSS